jgi:hypothetical protein
MSPSHFEKAKELMQSIDLLTTIGEGRNVNFSLPSSGPSKSPLSCKLSPLSEVEDTDVDTDKAPPVDSDGSVSIPAWPESSIKAVNKRSRKTIVALVETQVTRSPRVQKNKKGFKSPTYKDRGCLGCNFAPTLVSKKAIRKLSATFYDIAASQVTDIALNKKKKGTTPIGTVPPKKDKEA